MGHLTVSADIFGHQNLVDDAGSICPGEGRGLGRVGWGWDGGCLTDLRVLAAPHTEESGSTFSVAKSEK